LAQDLHTPHTLIFYESPYRIAALVDDALAVYGDRQAALANDLTKFHEAVWRGPLSQIKSVLKSRAIKGEFVLLIAGSDGSDVMPVFGDDDPDDRDDEDIAD
jgi:16S rRNA (cytidine1402-2'-O)-methyltransferase